MVWLAKQAQRDYANTVQNVEDLFYVQDIQYDKDKHPVSATLCNTSLERIEDVGWTQEFTVAPNPWSPPLKKK